MNVMLQNLINQKGDVMKALIFGLCTYSGLCGCCHVCFKFKVGSG